MLIRVNPSSRDFVAVQRQLAKIEELERLDVIFRTALTADTWEDFVSQLDLG